ncbi:amidase domain-containing protein [Hathewaya limosa]|uniref:Putative amidase domain-containing protein n=1 Tax=Hathewaya limosa TaxID=1536 RepID=A0ABU0JXJ5_HATLI|nr:amidase domain-containing protein [Hathewaya limosa]MDQ0480893.1 hypothetical protein [Hathewaya limosa]
MRKKFYFNLIVCLICFSLIPINPKIAYGFVMYNNENIPPNSKSEFYLYVKNLFDTKNKVFFTGDFSYFKTFYDSSQKYGLYSLEHEVKRFSYLRDWASERGIKFTEITSIPIIKKVEFSGGYTKIRVDEEYKIKYIYKDDHSPQENVFGISLLHHMKLKKQNDSWKIYTDYYLDCFEDALKAYNVNLKETKLPQPKTQKYDFTKFVKSELELPSEYNKGDYKRSQAIKYADRYCGVTWATSGANPKYNKKYKNYTGIGGNCTNYVSQCLGDKEGGDLRHGGGWYAIYKKYNFADCSAAWVNADAFKNHLIYSGKGRLLKRGSFETLVTPSDNNPNGFIGKVQPGDIIAYEKKHKTDHNAIVTALDSHGYPMINSHTVERYHVPFDLGWGDNGIYFHLIHMR